MSQEETIKEIVLARLRALPENIGISFGVPEIDYLNKEQMIQHVTEGDAIGAEIIDIQMDFLMSLKNLQHDA